MSHPEATACGMPLGPSGMGETALLVEPLLADRSLEWFEWTELGGRDTKNTVQMVDFLSSLSSPLLPFSLLPLSSQFSLPLFLSSLSLSLLFKQGLEPMLLPCPSLPTAGITSKVHLTSYA